MCIQVYDYTKIGNRAGCPVGKPVETPARQAGGGTPAHAPADQGCSLMIPPAV